MPTGEARQNRANRSCPQSVTPGCTSLFAFLNWYCRIHVLDVMIAISQSRSRQSLTSIASRENNLPEAAFAPKADCCRGCRFLNREALLAEYMDCRILIVDDNRGSTVIISALLKKAGYQRIELAHDGLKALNIVAEFRPHLILLDIGLPKLDGYQVGQRIRKNPEYDDILLVALTGYGQEEDRRRALSHGFDVHLVKPVSFKQLEQLFIHPKLQQVMANASSGS